MEARRLGRGRKTSPSSDDLWVHAFRLPLEARLLLVRAVEKEVTVVLIVCLNGRSSTATKDANLMHVHVCKIIDPRLSNPDTELFNG